MDMFSSFNSSRGSVAPLTDDVVVPAKAKLPYTEYDSEGEIIGYWWYEGDTPVLEFTIEGAATYLADEAYIDAKDYLEGKSVSVQLFNFRRELIDEKIYKDQDDMTTIIYEITPELAKKLPKNPYYIKVTVFTEALVYTILGQQECSITVR